MSQHLRHASSSSLPHRTSHSSSTPSTTSSTTRVTAATGAGSPAATETGPAPTPATNPAQPQSQAQSQSQSQSQSHSQSTSAIPQSTGQPQGQSIQEVVRRIVSPGSILFQHQPPPLVTRQRTQRPPTQSVDMDRRHPSSFQQLEKLGEGTYATVCLANLVNRKHVPIQVQPDQVLAMCSITGYGSSG